MYEKNNEKRLKKKVSVSEKKIWGTDTEIWPWFRFPIPTPNFSRTLGTSPLDGPGQQFL